MITINYFDGLPTEYESFLVERYGSFVTTCRYIQIYYPTCSFYYLKVSEQNKLLDLLIFFNDNETANCLNQFVEIDQDILKECMKVVFKENNQVTKILISASYKEYSLKKSILYSKSNDHIIYLQSNIDDYYSNLGKTTRKTLKKQKSKLLRDFPNVNFVYKFKKEIDEELIEKIVQLNFERMKYKGVTYGNERDKNSIFEYAQLYGFVTYIEIDDEIVAGTISYIINDKLFGYIVGHDEGFSKYSLGIICQIIEIKKSIELELKSYHFLWGDNQYKKRLLAQPYPLYSYYFFKNYSIDFIVTKFNAFIFRAMICVRLSKFSKPLRDFVKKLRKKQNVQ